MLYFYTYLLYFSIILLTTHRACGTPAGAYFLTSKTHKMHIKNALFLFGLLLISSSSIAQRRSKSLIPALAKKNWVVGINGNYTNQNHTLYPEVKTTYPVGITDTFPNATNIGISVNAGTMFAQNFYLGLDAHQTWQSRHKKQQMGDTSTVTHFWAGLQMRYYIPITTKFTAYMEVAYGYMSDNSDSKVYQFYQNGQDLTPILRNTSTIRTTGSGGYAGIGVMYMLNKNIGIDAGVRYQGSQTKGKRTDSYPVFYTSSAFQVNTYDYVYDTKGFGARLGLQFFLFN